MECNNAPGKGLALLPFPHTLTLKQVELVDFGATRSYSPAFIDNWLRLLLAAAQKDREDCLRWSLELGYLTGDENDVGLTKFLSTVIYLTGALDHE